MTLNRGCKKDLPFRQPFGAFLNLLAVLHIAR